MNIVICLPSDEKHYLLTNISFIYVYNTETKKSYYNNINLVDFDIIDNIPELKDKCLVFNKKLLDRFFYLDSYDLETQSWIKTGKSFYNRNDYKEYYKYIRFYKNYEDNRKYIPFYKTIDYCKKIIDNALKIKNILEIDDTVEFYSKIVYDSICKLETNGLAIDVDLFNEFFNKKYTTNIVYTNYNLHTTTGRPSNTFDNVNYSALNKKDNSRSSFISRFRHEGVLVEFDFDAYHLRLISKLINYKFKEERVHTYFAKLYFNKNEIDEIDYENSKAISFKLLYGGLTEEYEHIEFFRLVEDYKNKIWDDYKEKGYLKSPISKRILVCDQENKSKLFSYFLQMIETEVSVIFIKEVLNILNNKKSRLVLYTYDSFLLDFFIGDGKEVIVAIKNLLKNVTIKVGTNYNELARFRL